MNSFWQFRNRKLSSKCHIKGNLSFFLFLYTFFTPLWASCQCSRDFVFFLFLGCSQKCLETGETTKSLEYKECVENRRNYKIPWIQKVSRNRKMLERQPEDALVKLVILAKLLVLLILLMFRFNLVVFPRSRQSALISINQKQLSSNSINQKQSAPIRIY